MKRIFASCNIVSESDIQGKWYNADDVCLEVFSDNTYIVKYLNTSDDVYSSGEWKYLKDEEFFKFTQNNKSSVFKIKIKDDDYGSYLEFDDLGRFYKNKYPKKKIENESKKQEESNLIKCPNFIGQNYESIDINNQKYKLEVVQSYSPNAGYGIIYDQSPAAETPIKEGATIKVYVSLGQKTIEVPNLEHYDLSKAISTLKIEGLEYEIVERPDENCAANTVINTSPAAGSTVNIGTKITIYVSSGKQ